MPCRAANERMRRTADGGRRAETLEPTYLRAGKGGRRQAAGGRKAGRLEGWRAGGGQRTTRVRIARLRPYGAWRGESLTWRAGECGCIGMWVGVEVA